MSFQVRDFNVDSLADCERLAAMFNDFDSAWPGGFTRGMDMTGMQVQERQRRSRHLAVLIVEDGEEFVAYCDLEAEPGQLELAYIGLLGARESAHGKGAGKMLLREMVRRVTALDYKQVTLHTWPGNTKAVPLYKKTGFHWVPDTDVFMRNFLPTILNMTLVQQFLDGRDWYECLDRELNVAPDDVTWQGMKVYPYRFRNGDRTLSLTFDASGEGLTAIETDAYAVSCTPGVEEAAAGQTYPLRWEFTVKNGGPFDALLLVEAETGLNLSVQEQVRVADTTTIVHDLHISSETLPKPEDLPAYRIKSTLIVNEQPIVLETGVKVVAPVDIAYKGEKLFVGRREQIRVLLHNKLDRDLNGTLALGARAGLECDAPIQNFTLPAKSWTQCEYHVFASTPGVIATTLVLEAGDVRTARPVTFRVLDANSVVGSVDSAFDEFAVLDSRTLHVHGGLRGGGLSLYSANPYRKLLHLGMADLGPPFVDERLRPPLFAAHVQPGANGDALVFTGELAEMPGLRLERIVTQMAGDVVRVDYRIYNQTAQVLAAKLRTKAWPHLHGHLVLPSPDGILREPMQGWGDDFPSGDYDIVAHGDRLAENWMACEEDGLTCGIVWEGDPKQESRWSPFVNLTYTLDDIPAYGFQSAPSMYIVAGGGSWETVRGWWQKLVQPSGNAELDKPELKRVLEIKAEPSLLTANGQTITLTIQNRREKKLSGKLTFAGDCEIVPAQLEVKDINRKQSFTAALQVQMQEQPTARILTVNVDTGPATETRKIPLVRLGNGGETRITTTAEQQIEADNGLLRFRVAAAFGGAMTALETEGVNHLFSAWPTAKPFLWANPWHGGVHPILGWMGDSRLLKEAWTAQPVYRSGVQGISWQGVRVVCEPKHKTLTWLRVEADYLTTPGSNVIALVTRWTNKTDAQMQVPDEGGMAAWLQVGGAHEHTVSHRVLDGEHRVRRRGGFASETFTGNWKAVENAVTKETLLMVSAAPSGTCKLEDFGAEGAHVSVQSKITLPPRATKETLGWLVLCRTAEEIEAYAAALSECRMAP